MFNSAKESWRRPELPPGIGHRSMRCLKGIWLPWPQLSRGNALIEFIIQVLQGNTEMREEEPFCSRGFIFGCPKLPGAARLNVTTSREEAGGASWEPWGDSLIVAAGFKTQSQEHGELIQPLRQIRQLPFQVLDQGAGTQQGDSRDCPTSWGWWDSAGDLHLSPFLQLSVDPGRDSGPQHDGQAYLLWEESRGRNRKHKQ